MFRKRILRNIERAGIMRENAALRAENAKLLRLLGWDAWRAAMFAKLRRLLRRLFGWGNDNT